MDEFISVTETHNGGANIGTISTKNVEANFKRAIEAHFDLKLSKIEFIGLEEGKLTDCIRSRGISVEVTLCNLDGSDDTVHEVQLEQTWLYK